VFHRAEPFQSELDALVVVVVNLVVHARFQRLKVIERGKMEVLCLSVSEKLSITALSKQLPLQLML
jgi:hypothetical protein